MNVFDRFMNDLSHAPCPTAAGCLCHASAWPKFSNWSILWIKNKIKTLDKYLMIETYIRVYMRLKLYLSDWLKNCVYRQRWWVAQFSFWLIHQAIPNPSWVQAGISSSCLVSMSLYSCLHSSIPLYTYYKGFYICIIHIIPQTKFTCGNPYNTHHTIWYDHTGAHL
jgi:hypothetical protein